MHEHDAELERLERARFAAAASSEREAAADLVGIECRQCRAEAPVDHRDPRETDPLVGRVRYPYLVNEMRASI
jgi:hypothetical protein